MIIYNCWYVAAWSDEVAETPFARRICDTPLVLFRRPDGSIAALRDECSHRGAPLSLGRVANDGTIECGYHGLRFNECGTCTLAPGQRRVSPKAHIQSYPVAEFDGLIWVWPGERDKADIASIPRFPYVNQPERYKTRRVLLPMCSNSTLLIDNLMDLSHVAYLHKSTVGSGDPMAHVSAKFDVEERANGLKFTKWIFDTEPPAAFANLRDYAGKIDRWSEQDLFSPGSLFTWIGMMEAGAGAYESEQLRAEKGLTQRLFHGMTPETEDSCHYFFVWASDFPNDDMADSIWASFEILLEEDRMMVDAQAERNREFGEDHLVPIASDDIRMRVKRIMTRLKSAEDPSNAQPVAQV
ncbi:aromatic ring-hydroxylating dioxygenase subunit alpha [Amycolatopsis pithecellobii]|uniref:Rieske 2Fe-2S domain-containing protein n=1 Tax=Amycolatopsis pithecellobii TaxID=664692 RepID=A0A6N7Z358_9PSEU|nr:aromatic ring-hydroxylating dioxygenase subunit alpha [Amycolatopsis pithecellobii]MTD55489.1 Rieske 2Fe-2S domain-containing protein [Amycolatopsis pithecellobii]